MAFGKRGFQDNNNNNTDIILRLIELRKKRAKLLGYDSHAAFVLEERMATSEENVVAFLEDLYQKAYPAAQGEWQEMEHFAKQNLGLNTLEKWDTAYVSENSKSTIKVGRAATKTLFPIGKGKAGVLDIANKLYGLHFKKNSALEGYHTDVEVFEVYNREGDFYALLYTDFFPRPGKRSGAWMTSYRGQKKGQRPHISIVCNFSKPTASSPSLLTFQEVTTLFTSLAMPYTELANTTYGGLSGTNVYWDFVELPSQIMENWCYEKEALELFAKHYRSQEVIPWNTLIKLKKQLIFSRDYKHSDN